MVNREIFLRMIFANSKALIYQFSDFSKGNSQKGWLLRRLDIKLVLKFQLPLSS